MSSAPAPDQSCHGVAPSLQSFCSMIKSCPTWLVAVALALGGQGCAGTEDEVDVVFPENTGIINVRWSIDGRTSATDCAAQGAVFFEIVVFNELGGFASRDYAPCADFARAVQLPEGTWSTEFTLVDQSALPVTERQRFDDLRVVEDEEIDVDVNFPLESFL
jgi:hypothetical protein